MHELTTVREIAISLYDKICVYMKKSLLKHEKRKVGIKK